MDNNTENKSKIAKIATFNDKFEVPNYDKCRIRWTIIGFLDGVDDDKQEALARCFESAADELINHNNGKYERCLDEFSTVLFPIVRRLFSAADIEVNTPEMIFELYEEYLKIADCFKTIRALNIDWENSKMKDFDIEAESVALLCEHYANTKKGLNFNNKENK